MAKLIISGRNKPETRVWFYDEQSKMLGYILATKSGLELFLPLGQQITTKTIDTPEGLYNRSRREMKRLGLLNKEANKDGKKS